MSESDVLLCGPLDYVNRSTFSSVNASLVRSTSLQLSGSAGMSGMDAAAWRRLCCSFGKASTTLCSAVAGLTRHLATTHVDPKGISALLAGRLIPLDKNPGVRPIGIGEVLRRFIAKLILRVVGRDVQKAAGSLQVCAGHDVGAEAACHTVRQMSSEEDCQCVLLVDASNAFNSLNRRAKLHNIQYLCPSLATITCNYYRSPGHLFAPAIRQHSFIHHQLIFGSIGTPPAAFLFVREKTLSAIGLISGSQPSHLIVDHSSCYLSPC